MRASAGTTPSVTVPHVHFSQPTLRQVYKDAAVIALHTLMSGSEVRIDAPPPLAACGLRRGTAYVQGSIGSKSLETYGE